MLQSALDYTGYVLLGAFYAATPLAMLAGLNEAALRILARRR